MALPIIPILKGLAWGATGLISWFSYKETKKANKIAEKSNILTILGMGLTIIIALSWFFSSDSEEKFDIKNYYKDGTIHYTGNGTFENREDVWKWYSPDGILIKVETYDDNELDGEYKEFYSNGNIKVQGVYDDGEKEVDEWKCFDMDGSSKECKE